MAVTDDERRVLTYLNREDMARKEPPPLCATFQELIGVLEEERTDSLCSQLLCRCVLHKLISEGKIRETEEGYSITSDGVFWLKNEALLEANYIWRLVNGRRKADDLFIETKNH